MSRLSDKQILAVNKDQYHTLIRRAIEDLMGPASLPQLKRLLWDVEALELLDPPPSATTPAKPLKPRFKIIRRRRGMLYDPAYRTSLKGAEKLALSYFNGDGMQPHEVLILGTNDQCPPLEFHAPRPKPRWLQVVHLKLWEVKMHKGRAKGPTLEVAAESESTAKARAEAAMGIGYRVTSVKRVA